MQVKVKPEWSKGKLVVDLPHTTPQAFQLYVDWLYNGFVSPAKYATLEETSKAYFVLGNAYVLGEEIHNTLFQNAIIDSLYKRYVFKNFMPVVYCVVYIITVIYNGTTDHSGGRNFVTDMVIMKEVDQELWDYSEELHKDFFRDLALKYYVKKDFSLGELNKVRQRWVKPLCTYQSHDGDTGCSFQETNATFRATLPKPAEVGFLLDREAWERSVRNAR